MYYGFDGRHKLALWALPNELRDIGAHCGPGNFVSFKFFDRAIYAVMSLYGVMGVCYGFIGP